MNMRKLSLIVVIFVIVSIAWLFLGGAISQRTRDSQKKLGQDVEQMYGPRDPVQRAPLVTPTGDAAASKRASRPPDSSAVNVRFEHENRYRGLIWFSVYRVQFEGVYTVAAAPGQAGPFRFLMSLPRETNNDAISIQVDGKPLDVQGVDIVADVNPTEAKPAEVKVSYVTWAQDSWSYDPQSNGAGLRKFTLSAQTNFRKIDYPSDGLSPTQASDIKGGRQAIWEYSQMVPAADRRIGIIMPSVQSSGDLAARISRFAPVSLFFFLTVMVTIQLIRNLNIHPMNYLLIAAAFFAFHILLAYLVDHVTIQVAFWICSAVSVFLVVSYLCIVVGPKHAILSAGAAQMIYLVFFSYAFFWHGWTGLTVVIGAIITLFLIMMLTARIKWDEKFPDLARRREPFDWRNSTPPPPMAVMVPQVVSQQPAPASQPHGQQGPPPKTQ